MDNTKVIRLNIAVINRLNNYRDLLIETYSKLNDDRALSIIKSLNYTELIFLSLGDVLHDHRDPLYENDPLA